MASAGWSDLEVYAKMEGYEARSARWGGMGLLLERAGVGHHPPELFRGLPNDMCPCPHWGYLISGSFTVEYADRSETVVGGQAFYIPPGHLAKFEEDSECVEFSPLAQLEEVYEVVRRNAAVLGSLSESTELR